MPEMIWAINLLVPHPPVCLQFVLMSRKYMVDHKSAKRRHADKKHAIFLLSILNTRNRGSTFVNPAYPSAPLSELYLAVLDDIA